jgi:hypothetical protein
MHAPRQLFTGTLQLVEAQTDPHVTAAACKTTPAVSGRQRARDRSPTRGGTAAHRHNTSLSSSSILSRPAGSSQRPSQQVGAAGTRCLEAAVLAALAVLAAGLRAESDRETGLLGSERAPHEQRRGTACACGRQLFLFLSDQMPEQAVSCLIRCVLRRSKGRWVVAQEHHAHCAWSLQSHSRRLLPCAARCWLFRHSCRNRGGFSALRRHRSGRDRCDGRARDRLSHGSRRSICRSSNGPQIGRLARGACCAGCGGGAPAARGVGRG